MVNIFVLYFFLCQAQYHFLVIPKESIASVANLKTSHVPLLKHVQEKGEELAAR